MKIRVVAAGGKLKDLERRVIAYLNNMPLHLFGDRGKAEYRRKCSLSVFGF